jgi:enoyl-CoA hydratase/carnithine racemase
MELAHAAGGLGLHYYPSGLQRYVERLGLGAAKRLFLLAETLGGEELLRMGYLDPGSAATDPGAPASVADPVSSTRP